MSERAGAIEPRIRDAKTFMGQDTNIYKVKCSEGKTKCDGKIQHVRPTLAASCFCLGWLWCSTMRLNSRRNCGDTASMPLLYVYRKHYLGYFSHLLKSIQWYPNHFYKFFQKVVLLKKKKKKSGALEISHFGKGFCRSYFQDLKALN